MAAQLTHQALQIAAMRSSSTPKTASLSLTELLGVAVAMYSWAGERGILGTVEEEVSLKDALATLALQWRSCDLNFLSTLGIGKW